MKGAYPWRDGQAELIWWLVLRPVGIAELKRSPIQELTGPDVE